MHNEGAAQAEQFARNSPTYWSIPFYRLEIYECHLIVPLPPLPVGLVNVKRKKKSS